MLVFGGSIACGGGTESDPRTRGAVDGGQRADVPRGGGEDAGAHGGGNALSPDSGAGGTGPAGAGGSPSGGSPSGGSPSGDSSSGGASATGGALATGGNAGDVGAGGTEARGGAGGTEAGGTGGTESEVPRPELLPEQCELRFTPDFTETACSLSAQCDGRVVTTTCEEGEAGAWQCSCGFNASGEVLEIDGATGIEACAGATGLCTAPELDADAESCLEVMQPSSPDACSLTRSCTREIRAPLPQGVEARWRREYKAECGPFGSAFECHTEGVESAFPSYKVITSDVSAACGPYLDYVLRGEAPLFGSTVACAGSEFEPSASGCSVVRRCGPVMGLAAGVELGDLQVNYGVCNEESDGSTGCYCEYRQAQLLFTEQGASSNELCEEIASSCVDGAAVQPLSELECAETSLLAFEDSCEVYATCEQEVVANDRAAHAEATVAGACQWAPDTGAWSCRCQDLAQELELSAPDLTAFDACSLLPEACAERLAVFAGPAEPESP